MFSFSWSRDSLRRLARMRRTARGWVHPARQAWDAFVDWFNALELSENAILLVFALAIGAAGALGVIAFYKLIDYAFAVFYELPPTRVPWLAFPTYRPLLTAAGIATAWWLVRRLGRERDGSKVRSLQLVPYVQLAVARRGGHVRGRVAFSRVAAAAITLGSGGSAGSEGPVAVLGSGAASFLGRAFRFDASRVKVLVGAGAAAGISAAFNAPLAGAFFALEEIMGSFAVRAFPPVVVSSITAAMISRAVFGNHPAFPVPQEYGYVLGREVFLFYPLLGVVCAVAAVIFVRTFFGVESAVRRMRIPAMATPWLGGAIVGLLVLASGGILVGYGHLSVQLDVFGRMAWTTLMLLALGEILATSITLNAGGSGGVFSPSLYVGAATGGAFGVALSGLFPGLGLHPEAYALVGMGAVFAATTDAPIAAILIVFEMTNDYAIVLPLMLATAISYLVARRLEPDSLYSGWLRRRGERIQHGADRDVLAGLSVGDAYQPNPQVIGEAATVAELLEHLGTGEQTDFPVVDPELRFVGMITVAELGRIAKDQRDLAPLLIAGDVARPAEAIALSDSLLDAIHMMGVRGTASLPVVESESGRLAGLISRADILGVYERAVAGAAVTRQSPV